MVKLPPARLGRYEVIREIARSNDIVYEGWDPQTSRKVAIKQLQVPPGASTSQVQERVQRFEREARASGALIHPNIAIIFDQGRDGDVHYMVMEFLEGETLSARLQREGSLDPQEAVRLAVQLLKALEAAHALGVVHRDVKPENIFLTAHGVKLADFGIARIAHEQALTLAGQVFGTPSYMAPEQVAGGEVNERSDLWAFGVVLFEMLTGTHPFRKASVLETLNAVTKADPPYGAVNDVELRGVLRSLIVKDLTQRSTSAKAVRVLLEAYQSRNSQGATISLSTQATYAASPQAHKTRTPWSFVAMAAIAIIVGVAGFREGQMQSETSFDKAVRESSVLISSMATLIESSSSVRDLAQDASYDSLSHEGQHSKLKEVCESVLGGKFTSLDGSTQDLLVAKADSVIAKAQLEWERSTAALTLQSALDNQRQQLVSQATSSSLVTEGTTESNSLNSKRSSKALTIEKRRSKTKSFAGGMFTIGSTENEVRAAQGTPSAVDVIVDETHYSYGLSKVVFKGGQVVEYRNTDDNLHVVWKPASKSKCETFSIGSPQDEVLSVMGTPSAVDMIVDEIHLSYGLSKVVLKDDRVTEYRDTDNNLKVH